MMFSGLLSRLGKAPAAYLTRPSANKYIFCRTFSQRFTENQSCTAQFKAYSRRGRQFPWPLLGGISCFLVANCEGRHEEQELENKKPVTVFDSQSLSSSSSFVVGDDEVVMSIKRGKLAEMKKELKQAEEHYHNALMLLSIYERNRSWEMSRIVQARVYVYDCMANLSLSTGKLSDAEILFKETLRGVLQLGRTQDDDEVIEISLKLAMIYAAQNKDDDATQGYEFCIKSLEKKLTGLVLSDTPEAAGAATGENTHALLGMCVDSYSRFLLSRRRYEEATECMERAVNIAQSVLGQRHPQLAVLHNDLATILSLRQQYTSATKHIKQAIEIGIATDSADLPVFYCNLASLHRTVGDIEAARAEYHRAYDWARKYKDKEMESKAREALKHLKDDKKKR